MSCDLSWSSQGISIKPVYRNIRSSRTQNHFWSLLAAGTSVEIERNLNEARATPYDCDANGNTLLHYAVLYDHTELCLLFNDYGTKWKSPNCYGYTALEEAYMHAGISKNGALYLTRSDLDLGIPHNVKSLGLSALHEADLGLPSVTVHEQLGISARDLLDTRDTYGRTALMMATMRSDDRATLELIRHGPDYDEVDCKGRSALHYAAGSGSQDCATLLLDAGAIAAKIDDHGANASYYAARHASPQQGLIKLLVSHGSDIHRRFRPGGWTPTHVAASTGNAATLGIILADTPRISDDITPTIAIDVESMPPIIHLMICKFKNETLPAAEIEDMCKSTLDLKNKCLHPKTGAPYVQSIRGGTDMSVQGHHKGMTHAFIIDFESAEDRTYFLTEDPVHSEHAKAFIMMIDMKDGDFYGMTLDFVPGEFKKMGV